MKFRFFNAPHDSVARVVTTVLDEGAVKEEGKDIDCSGREVSGETSSQIYSFLSLF